MYCNKCGFPLDSDSLFCPKCGSDLSELLAFVKKTESSGEPLPAESEQEASLSNLTTPAEKEEIVVPAPSAAAPSQPQETVCEEEERSETEPEETTESPKQTASSGNAPIILKKAEKAEPKQWSKVLSSKPFLPAWVVIGVSIVVLIALFIFDSFSLQLQPSRDCFEEAMYAVDGDGLHFYRQENEIQNLNKQQLAKYILNSDSITRDFDIIDALPEDTQEQKYAKQIVHNCWYFALDKTLADFYTHDISDEAVANLKKLKFEDENLNEAVQTSCQQRSWRAILLYFEEALSDFKEDDLKRAAEASEQLKNATIFGAEA